MPPVCWQTRYVSWFADLTRYTYLTSEPTNPPTLNIGWLARDHAFPTGDVPAAFIARLEQLCAHATTQQTRGLHRCELCVDDIPDDDYARMSSAEIRAVAADGTRYAAPRLILHYVTAHLYAPPDAFIEAVLRPQAIDWHAALAHNVCLSCGGLLEEERRERRWVFRTPETRELATFAWCSCKACGTTYTRTHPPDPA